MEVNNVVLFHDHDFTPDLSWDDSKPHICEVYSEEEVDQLKACGVELPDCPLEMLPGGYYDWSFFVIQYFKCIKKEREKLLQLDWGIYLYFIN